MIINPKLTNDKLIETIHRAAFEYSKLVGNSYLIIGKNRKSEYFWFQCDFEKKYFMHLLGIDSKTLGAVEFFDKCDAYNTGKGEGVIISDCTPSRNHNRRTVNEKSSCCVDILKIQDAKYMKIGLKDKISQYVDFTYGYGGIATLGFKKLGNTSFPITLIPRDIDEFISKKYKIILILTKAKNDIGFKNISMEIKEGIFRKVYDEFPEELRRLCIMRE